MAERDPALLRSQRAARRGLRRRNAPGLRKRRLLHRLQLRTGAPRHPGRGTRPLGPHHSRRGPADQELGIEDRPRDQGAEVALRPGPQRHAAGEPPRRALFGDAVRRRAPLAAGLPLLPSPSRGQRERQGAGLQEPRSASRAAPRHLAPPHPRLGLAATPAANDGAGPHSRHRRAERPARRPHADRADDHAEGVYLGDGPAAAAKGPADVPHDGQQHVPGRQEEAALFQQARIPGGTAGRPVRRGQPQGPHVLRVDDDAGPDRAALEGPQAGLSCGWTARCRRRTGRPW